VSNEEADELASIIYSSRAKTEEICARTTRILTTISSSALNKAMIRYVDSDEAIQEASTNDDSSSSGSSNVARIPVNYESPQPHQSTQCYALYPQLTVEGYEDRRAETARATYVPLSAPPTPPVHLPLPPAYTAAVWSSAGGHNSPAPSAPCIDEVDSNPDASLKKALAFCQ
jgi:hypothetical protein